MKTLKRIYTGFNIVTLLVIIMGVLALTTKQAKAAELDSSYELSDTEMVIHLSQYNSYNAQEGRWVLKYPVSATKGLFDDFPGMFCYSAEQKRVITSTIMVRQAPTLGDFLEDLNTRLIKVTFKKSSKKGVFNIHSRDWC